MPDLPGARSSLATGTVTFLFTDIEGSTRLWEQEPVRMADALARHDRVCRAAVETHGGRLVKMIGDGLHAVFADPAAALVATLELQHAAAAIALDYGLPLKIRCGLHAGPAQARDDDYFGSTVNRAARIASAAHGGQILLSQAVVDLAKDRLPIGAGLMYLGRARLRDLSGSENLWQLLYADLPRVFPALRSLDSTPNNLPELISSFVGREGEIGEAKRLLAEHRLLTLVGMGGIGKTRLSLQLAADVIDSYPDGVWLIEFGPTNDPAMVAAAVAQVLGLQEQARTPLLQTLCAHLRSCHLLLVFDNCEHLLTACAELAGALLVAAPGIHILATSREPLQVDGEQCLLLPPLSLPSPTADAETVWRSDAVQLFVERARLKQPNLALAQSQAAIVAAICGHLDGIPLALELAAARVATLSVEQINAHLGDRFRLLVGGSRRSLARQQTLRATLDWSYELLTEHERVVLRRLAIFSGGFTLEGASSVVADPTIAAADVLELLSQLVARSLVVAEASTVETRYRLLETTRAYVLEKLAEVGETRTIQRQHAQYYRARFEHSSEDWLRMGDSAWQAIYLPERDNLRVALDWAFSSDGDVPIGIGLAGASAPLWWEGGPIGEGRRRLETASAKISQDTPEIEQARIWLWAGLLSGESAAMQAATSLGRSVDLYRRLNDPLGLGYALARLGRALGRAGRFDQAEAAFAEALPLLEAAQSTNALGGLYNGWGTLALLRGDHTSAETRWKQALSLFIDGGGGRSALYIRGYLADLTWLRGNLDEAFDQCRECVELIRQLPSKKTSLGLRLGSLAGIHVARGKLEAALDAGRESLQLLNGEGETYMVLDYLALRAALLGKYSNAARTAGYTDSIFTKIAATRPPNQARARTQLETLLQGNLSSDERKGLLEEGAKMNEDQACRVALAA
jgi:predicted ATPase/class 3 adenylate cyclase